MGLFSAYNFILPFLVSVLHQRENLNPKILSGYTLLTFAKMILEVELARSNKEESQQNVQ